MAVIVGAAFKGRERRRRKNCNARGTVTPKIQSSSPVGASRLP
jgi:hypothetical protein